MTLSSHSTRTESQTRLQALLERAEIVQALAQAKHLQDTKSFDPVSAELLLKAARTWHAEGFFDAQREACEIILGILPEHFEALHLLGFHAQAQGDFAKAEEYYVRALAIKPGFAFAKLALSQLRMMRTGFSGGRDLYEARFDAVTEGSGPDWRGLPIPRWRGEPLAGKKIYLWAEQGLGDIVMFAGFLPYLLAQSPARIALGMFPKLCSLFARSFPGIDIESIDDAVNHALAPSVLAAFPQIEALAQHASVPFSLEPLRVSYAYVQRHGLFDFAAPLGDMLVYAMPGFVPAQHPAYLRADPALIAATRTRLAPLGQGKRIGISWHTTNRREPMRNIPLELWLPLLRLPDCHFVSLQHSVEAQEIARVCKKHNCRITVDAHVDPLADAQELAALIGAMDAVVTIDNANAHIAGALGIPTAMLLPKGHNYRWPEIPNDGTLWYKSVTALRQYEMGNWLPVIDGAVRWIKKPGYGHSN